jgi:hypothetical protein
VAPERTPEPPGLPGPVAGDRTQPPAPDATLVSPPETDRWRVGVSLGSGSSYGHSYVMFGGILGYQLPDGFELALDGQYWGGANPNLGRIAPGLNWYAPIHFRPYLGVYYAHWFIGGQADQNAIGARIGLTLTSTPTTAFAAGLAFERALGCTVDCGGWWPEMSFGFRF